MDHNRQRQIENREVMMLLDLLHFGDGPQAINYFILCFFAILGTLQIAAIRYNRRDLKWLDGQVGVVSSILLVAGSFAWFFITDKEIFIPGLAGGELFTIFIVAFVAAVPVTRMLAFALASLRAKRGSLPAPWGLLRGGVGTEQSRVARASRNDREPTI